MLAVFSVRGPMSEQKLLRDFLSVMLKSFSMMLITLKLFSDFDLLHCNPMMAEQLHLLG